MKDQNKVEEFAEATENSSIETAEVITVERTRH
jgi:hypothetical protein